MSVDQLQNKIRKMKNPSMVLFSFDSSVIPSDYRTTDDAFVSSIHVNPILSDQVFQQITFRQW